jgi:predicted HicB family RNase H-like nuclease
MRTPLVLQMMLYHSIIELEGYYAKIERGNDGILYGRVIGLEEIINFKAATQRVVERAFSKAMEAYFERCKVRGVEPEKPRSLGF